MVDHSLESVSVDWGKFVNEGLELAHFGLMVCNYCQADKNRISTYRQVSKDHYITLKHWKQYKLNNNMSVKYITMVMTGHKAFGLLECNPVF